MTLVCPPEFPTPLLEKEHEEVHPLTIELKMIAGIPGTEDGNAFWVFCASLAGITLMQVVVFKWLRWF